MAFLPLVGDPSDVEDIMRDLGEGIEEVGRELNPSCDLDVGVGFAKYPEDGCFFHELDRRADAALYYAKRSGKNARAVYDVATL